MLFKAIEPERNLIMSADLNTLFDDVQDGVVDQPNPDDVAGEAELDDQEQEEEETLDNEDQSGDDGGEPGHQTREDNHQFAEFRKNAQAEINRIAGEAAQKDQLVNMLFEAGFKGEKNPLTGALIETVEDFIAWREESERQALQQAGLPPDYINQLINNHPVIRQAGAILQQNQQVQQKFAFDRELVEIQKMNPKIKSIDDLVAETKDDETFQALQKGGMSLSKAYATVHKIPQRKLDDTKGHLQSVGGGVGGDATEPPAETLKVYIDMGFTKKDAVEHWRKEHKNEK